MSAKSKAALDAAIETERENREKALTEFREWLLTHGFKQQKCPKEYELYMCAKADGTYHQLLFRTDYDLCLYHNEMNQYNGPLDIDHIKKCVLGYRWHGYYGDSK